MLIGLVSEGRGRLERESFDHWVVYRFSSFVYEFYTISVFDQLENDIPFSMLLRETWYKESLTEIA